MDELRVALELATEDELQDLTEILFRKKFNPLDYLQRLDPLQVQSHSRTQWLEAIEERFRFLAADGMTVLRGESQGITYRHVLIQVCRYLKIRFSPSLSTPDLEAEIFLTLIQRSWEKMPSGDKRALIERIQVALQTSANEPLPLNCHAEPLRLVVEGGSALALTSVVRPLVVRQIAQQLAVHFAAFQSISDLAAGSLLAQTARQGMAATALRYGATRSLLAVVSSALWVGFAVDLGWRTISTNYGRIIPIIFTLAQIRLTRAEWAYVV
jgi:uncharacterized protein YaaW (UPF0174 family)